jgi:hypothetical protein
MARQSSVQHVRQRICEEDTAPFFAKPQGRLKRFTGHVFGDASDLMYLEDASASTRVWCSEVVEWRSEYRVFVIRGRVVGVRHYSGDSSVPLDQQVVAETVRLLEQSGEARAAYGIDFGVLRDGSTALVELNDGFGLGSYGLDPGVYTDLTITRWCELTRCPPS